MTTTGGRWAVGYLLLLLLLACGSDDPAGSGGTAGVAGSGGVGGSAGSSGVGGSAGSSGVGGSAGSSGVGGNAGSSGIGGSAGASGSAGDGGTGGASGSAGDGGSGGAVPLMTDCAQSPWNSADFNQVIEVGTGQALATPSDVAWESIGPGTLVLIHARASAYHDKWVLNVAGTESDPVVVRGVPGDDGVLPQIRGDNAVTRDGINFWGEERSVIKIGGSNTPNNAEPSYIFVECLDIAGARAGNSYTGDDDAVHEYADNAAPITIESGDHITLRNNVFSDSGNGLFAAAESSDVRIIGNHIFDNGNVDSIYEHNSYTESLGILFEGNHYGPLCAGCLGNNLKDRSAGTVIRYNWIESGNRQLDLVDSDHADLIAASSYNTTFVYGNVLIEPDGAGNGQIVHYGGDSGDEASYRKGTLHFFHNTVVSRRSGNTTLVRLSSDAESMEARNNVVYVTGNGSSLAIIDGSGDARLSTNWLPTGWADTHGTLTGMVQDVGSLTGTEPGFINVAANDFTLNATSMCVGGAGPLDAETANHEVSLQIETPTVLIARPIDMAPDIGAFER